MKSYLGIKEISTNLYLLDRLKAFDLETLKTVKLKK